MSVNLGRDSFPDTILTASDIEVRAIFLARAASAPLQDCSAKDLIADWMERLRALRESNKQT